MSVTIYQVDAFTDRPFAGNPAAVCLLDRPPQDAWMSCVAAEMNLSETAFLCPRTDGWNLRWFTPTTEVKLCGHATLASAHVLWETGAVPSTGQIRFHTASGILTASHQHGWIELDFPAQTCDRADPPPDVERVLGLKPLEVCRAGWTWLARLDSASAVRRLAPDLAALKSTLGSLIVTAASDSQQYDFVSRFFAPVLGIDEDPVTGAAHCCLAPYWGRHLRAGELIGYQASRRGGVVRVQLAGERVKLRGQAVTVLRGELIQDWAAKRCSSEENAP